MPIRFGRARSRSGGPFFLDLLRRLSEQTAPQPAKEAGIDLGLGDRRGRRRGRRGRPDTLDHRLLVRTPRRRRTGLRLELFLVILGQRVGPELIVRQFVHPQPVQLEMRRFQRFVRDQQNPDPMPLFDGANRLAFLVEQKGGDLDGQLHDDPAGSILDRLFLNQPQHAQRQRIDVADGALAVAARADDVTGLLQRRTQPLPRHFQQAEAGDAAHLHPGAIHFQRLAQPGFHLALVAGQIHVNEINDDQPAQVAQPHLPGDFLGGFQIGGERGFLDVAALGGAGRVNVDGNQRFGVVDHDPAAGGQADFALVGGLDLGFDLEAGEQRDVVLIQLELVQVLRHHLLHEILGLAMDGRVVHQDFADVGAQIVAQGADDDVAFLIDQERRFLLR